jgi:hypothetical protein
MGGYEAERRKVGTATSKVKQPDYHSDKKS